jgi:cell division protease FtsH
MVGRWGMSKRIGPVSVIPMDGVSPLLPGASGTSESTQRLVDEEVKRIVESAHEDVVELLLEHRQNLDSLVRGLLEHETLDEAEAYEAAGLSRNTQARGIAGRPDGRGNGAGRPPDGPEVSRPDGSSGPVPHGTPPRAS